MRHTFYGTRIASSHASPANAPHPGPEPPVSGPGLAHNFVAQLVPGKFLLQHNAFAGRR